MNKKKAHVCVECKAPIPIYQNYLCETCYQKLLDMKLENA